MTHAKRQRQRERIANYTRHHTPEATAVHFDVHITTVYRSMREFGVQRVLITKVKR